MNNYFFYGKQLNKIIIIILFAVIVITVSGCERKNKVPITREEGNQVQNQTDNLPDSSYETANIKKANKKTQDDAGTGRDVTDDLQSPQLLRVGEYKGTLFPGPDKFGLGGDIDAYGIKWSPGETLKITVTPNKDLDIAFKGITNGHPSEISLHNNGLMGETEAISMTSDATSDITLAMIQVMSIKGEGDYTLKIEKISQNDGNQNQDAPEDWEQPLSISFGNYSNCFLGSKDEFDDYAIKLTSGQKILVQVEPSETLDVSLGRDEFHLTNQTNKGLKGEKEEISITAKEDGIYKFSVGKIGKTEGYYTLRVSAEQ